MGPDDVSSSLELLSMRKEIIKDFVKIKTDYLTLVILKYFKNSTQDNK